MGEISNARSEPRSDIVCLEANGARPSHHGDGFRVSNVMYTLNTTEVHGVAYVSNFKADGAVGGGIAFAVVGDHENRPTDMTNLVVLNAKANSDMF